MNAIHRMFMPQSSITAHSLSRSPSPLVSVPHLSPPACVDAASGAARLGSARHRATVRDCAGRRRRRHRAGTVFVISIFLCTPQSSSQCSRPSWCYYTQLALNALSVYDVLLLLFFHFHSPFLCEFLLLLLLLRVSEPRSRADQSAAHRRSDSRAVAARPVHTARVLLRLLWCVHRSVRSYSVWFSKSTDAFFSETSTNPFLYIRNRDYFFFAWCSHAIIVSQPIS